MRGLNEAAYRPFFALTGLVAVAAGLVWVLALLGVAGTVPGIAAAHASVLATGFIGAAVGGYLLSALPGWTGRNPISGLPLLGLVLAWGVGQGALMLRFGGAELALVLLYPLALGLYLAAHLIAARVPGRLWVLGFPAGLALPGVAFARGGGLWEGQEQALALALMLGISAIGGRMISAFGASHLQRRGDPLAPALVRQSTRAATVATAVLAVALGINGFVDGVGAGLVLVVAGVAQLWLPLFWLARLAGARRGDALFAMLPLAYLWLPLGVIGLGLLKAGIAMGGLSPTDAQHALTMGAGACMIAAIAGRAAARRGDGGLHARPVQILAFGLIWLAAASRALSGVAGGESPAGWILASALLWTSGWGLWLAALTPALFGPVRRPALSARRAPEPAQPAPRGIGKDISL